MKRISMSTVIATVTLVAWSAQGYEPPNASVADALRNGRIAFVGRTVRLAELSRTSAHEALGLAKFVVTKCLYGRACNRKTLEMEFTVDTQQDRRLGVDFILGATYLVVLKEDSQARPRFGSDWATTMDIAFRLLDEIDGSDEPISFVNVWLHNLVQRVSGRQVLLWGEQRRQALSRRE